MYAAPSSQPVAVGTQRRNIWPIAAICCLGLLGFLIAATIILALIPVYLPSKQATLNTNTANNNDTFYLQYVADGNENSSYTGTSQNLAELQDHMNSALGLSNALSIDAANVQTAFVRRRRSLLLFRKKRTIKNKFLFKCRPNYPVTCLSRRCRDGVVTRIQNACQNVRSLPSVPFQVQNRQFGLRSISLSLTFVGISFLRPTGFLGEPSNYNVFVAVKSGEFNDSTIWSEDVTPYGNCAIVISSGISVTISNSVMDLIVQKWDVYGSLGLGASVNDNFAFKYSTNIVVHSGGNLQDRTGSKTIFTRAGTLLTFYPGALFTGSNSVIRSFTALPAASNAGATLTLGSSISGPFTCGIISNTVIQSFPRVTFIVSTSGSFSNSQTWLGGVAPTTDVCSLVNGCGLYISSGCTLSTASLSGQLNINFVSITITSGASFTLGTSATSGFTFVYTTNIIVQSGGKLQDQTSGNRLYFLAGSLCTFYPGASFTGSNTVVYKYSSLPATGSLGASTTFGSSISGPFTFAILTTGIIQTFTSVTFLAVVSGDFNVAGTWLGSVAPTAAVCSLVNGCGLYISSGCTLSTASLNGQLNINFVSITITSGASFTLGTSATSGFTFVYTANVIVQSGGKLQDQTSGNQLYFLAGSLCTFYPGASFTGSNTVVYKYSSLPATGSLGASTTFGSSISGPFTFAILASGTIQTFTSVTFLAVASGDFNVAGTWLGSVAPTAAVCSLVNGCGLYISSGCTLSTASLSGQLNINFVSITITGGASFQLGTPTSSGFTFVYIASLIVQSGGKLQDQTSGNRLFFLAGSLCTFYRGASFTGSNTVVYKYSSLPATGSLGASTTFGSSISGPFTFAILTTGIIQTFTSVTFLAVVSGDFNVAETWLGSVAPTAAVCSLVNGCGLYISSGCTLSTASLSGQLNINFVSITITGGASFQLGTTATSGFTFVYIASLIVQSGGKLQDQTSGNLLYFLAGSLCTFYPGASFTGSNTVVYKYSSLPATGSLGASTTFGSSISGPFTFAILTTGTIQTFTSVTFLAVVSGDFNVAGTWLGGVAPTADICSLVNGCGLYISSGCILSTASLSGQLNINFVSITITSGASFTLGTSATSGFTFVYIASLIVQSGGILQDQTSGNRLYFLSGSLCMFYPGSLFTGSDTVVYQYTSLPAIGSLGASTTFGTSISGPFTFAILTTGTIQTFTSVTFLVSVSGSFTVTGTWLGGVVPTADICSLVNGCGLYISSGCTLSTASLNGQLNINFVSITITSGASFTLGTSATSGFTFAFAVNLIIQAGGTLHDLTGGNRLYFLSGSLCTLYPGAAFSGSSTVVYQFTSLPPTGSLGASTTFGSSFSGPFTFAVLLSGEIQTFASVTFLAVVSGDFGVAGTWLGGIAPTASLCSLADGCGLYIASGCVLSTASLNGELNINFNAITVISGATFKLGSADLTYGFRFLFAFTFNIFGTLSFLPSAGGSIYLPFGCAFNFYANAHFVSLVRITIRIYDVLIGGEGTILIYIDSSFTGPYFVSISLTGVVTESSEPATLSPGQTTTIMTTQNLIDITTSSAATTEIMSTEDLIDMTTLPGTTSLMG